MKKENVQKEENSKEKEERGNIKGKKEKNSNKCKLRKIRQKWCLRIKSKLLVKIGRCPSSDISRLFDTRYRYRVAIPLRDEKTSLNLHL